ncbi:MAG: hypothetical protein ACRCV5_13315, partial [Afipia sp.]
MATNLLFYGHFVASKTGKTGLTATVDIDKIEKATGTRTAVVTGGSATEGRRGYYLYLLTNATPITHDYVAIFITADTSVDQLEVPATRIDYTEARATELAYLDAAISSRLAAAGYTAPLDAGATETAAQAGSAAALTAYDAATAADVAAVPGLTWEEETADHATAGTMGRAMGDAGSATNPLTSRVPGDYEPGTGGYALGRLLAISNAALYSPATRNNQFLLAAAIQGALRPVQQVTWLDGEGVALDLTDATITGIIRNRTNGVTRAIAGDLDITQATDGIFTWTYDAADVADAGQFDVQFTATWDAPALSP